MKPEEKQIWSAHQQRLAALSRERAGFWKDYADRREALEATYGKDNIPSSEELKMAKEAIEKIESLNERDYKEIGRYMKEIEDYDRRRNTSPEKQTVNKEEKAQEPEKPALTGGSRFFNSLGYEKLKAQEAPDRSKDKSIDRDER